MAELTCECGWKIHHLKWHPAVHLVDHYTYDCPNRPESRAKKWRKRKAKK